MNIQQDFSIIQSLKDQIKFLSDRNRVLAELSEDIEKNQKLEKELEKQKKENKILKNKNLELQSRLDYALEEKEKVDSLLFDTQCYFKNEKSRGFVKKFLQKTNCTLDNCSKTNYCHMITTYSGCNGNCGLKHPINFRKNYQYCWHGLHGNCDGRCLKQGLICPLNTGYSK